MTTDTARVKAAIAAWRTERENHGPECIVFWDASRDCNPGGHLDRIDEFNWGVGGIRDTALSLTGKPRQNASPLMLAAYAFRDAGAAIDAGSAAHMAHHKKYRHNYVHPELGDCDRCDDWYDESAELQEVYENVRESFEGEW